MPEVGQSVHAGPRPGRGLDDARGRGDRHRRRGRDVGGSARRGSKLKILPPDREAPDRHPASGGRRSAARSRRSSSTSRTSSSSRARGRPTPSRSISARSRASRRSARSATTPAGSSSTRTPGRSTRAARGWPSRSCRSRIPRRGKVPHQGGRAVDLAAASPKQVELYLNDKKLKTWTGDGPYEMTIPIAEYSEATTCARRPSARTARKPTTSGCSRARTRRWRACASTSSSSTSPRSTRATIS